MRLWWGHPGVAQFGFWSLWNGVSGKSDYDVGLYDDEKQITPMGQAVMYLLNDRWRTRTTTTVGADGALTVPAAAGDYLVQWTADGQTYRAAFEFTLGETPVVIELVAPADHSLSTASCADVFRLLPYGEEVSGVVGGYLDLAASGDHAREVLFGEERASGGGVAGCEDAVGSARP